MPAPREGIFFASGDLVSPHVDRLMRLLSHLLIDPVSDDLLARLVAGLAAGFDPAWEIAFGGAATDRPWRTLTDPRVAPLEFMPHAAQWTGGTVPVKLPDEGDDAYLERVRVELEYPRGLRRTSERAAEITADPFLTDTKHFVVTPDADNPRILYVETIDAELADPAGMFAALNAPAVVGAGWRFEPVPTELTWNNNTSGHTWDTVAGGVTWDTATSGV